MSAINMPKLQSQLWTDPKGKRFVVLPEAEYLRLSELAEDRGLSRIMKDAIDSDSDAPSIPFDKVKKRLAARRRFAATKRKS